MAGVPVTTSGVNNGGGLGNIPPPQASVPQPQLYNAPAAAGAATSTPASVTGGGLGGLLGGILGGAANIYGSQNAAQNISSADTAAINTQNQTLGNINNLYQPQTALGNGAMGTLGSTLGVNGQPANYSNFLNMPGYQFAVQQGTQALQRQAAASGNAYTPNTGAAIGQYVTGTAMQDYNTYVSQLQNAAGLGAQANNTLTGANLQVGGNISQLLQNSGMAQASGVNNASGTVGNFLNQYGGQILNQGANYLTGGNGGVSGAISNWLNPTSLTSSDYAGINSGANAALSSDAASSGMYTSGTDAIAAQNAASGAAGIGNIAGITGAGGAGVAADLGLTGAGTAAGGVDTMALAQSGYASLGGVPGSLSAADTSAGAAGAGAGAGGVSAGVAALPAAAMLAIAAHQNPTALSQQYWNNLNASLAAGPGPDTANWGASNAGAGIQQYTTYEGALSSLGSAYEGQGKGNSTIPDSEWQTLAKYGITPQNIGNLSMSSFAQPQAYWDNLAASTGVPEYSKPSSQKK